MPTYYWPRNLVVVILLYEICHLLSSSEVLDFLSIKDMILDDYRLFVVSLKMFEFDQDSLLDCSSPFELFVFV